MKKDYEKAIKKSVSLPGLLLDDAFSRCRALRLSTFSDYIQQLIREDIKRAFPTDVNSSSGR